MASKKNREQWRPVFYNYYAVSNMGRVKRIKAGCGTRVGKILKPYSEYEIVKLHGNNKILQIKVDDLIYNAFPSLSK